MSTNMLDSTRNNEKHNFMSLGNYRSLNSVATNYVLSQYIHLLATEVVKGEYIPIIYLSILDKNVEGCLERKTWILT